MKRHLRALAIVIIAPIFLGILACNTLAPQPPPDLRHLQLQFLGGFIYANLMPMIPPDPIDARVILLARNTSSQSMTGLRVLKADVYLKSNDQRLGSIEFFSDWSGTISPNRQDTVVAQKVSEATKLFDPACGSSVYLTIFVGTDSSNSKRVVADNLTFSCVYEQ